MRVSRGIAALSLTAVAVLGLSACSSEAGDKADKPAAGAEASAPAEEVAEVESDFDLTQDDFIERVTAAAQAAGTVTMDMTTAGSGVTQTASGVIRYGDGAQDIAMTMEVPGTGTIEFMMVGGVVYMQMPELTGDKFLQIDPADTSNPLSQSFAGMEDQFDPTGTLAGLGDAVTSFEKVGEPQEVGGALAQEYTVVVDSAALSDTSVAEELAAAGTTLPPQLTYSYWIDADDQMRRVTTDVAGVTTEVTFSGWGEPVEITAPTADQIADMSSLGF
jgi:lipoprotein LprG